MRWRRRRVSVGLMDEADKHLAEDGTLFDFEEAVELVIAAAGGNPEAAIAESADLIYHWLVLMASSGVTLDQVAAELERREGVSGLAEKAGRKPVPSIFALETM